MLGGGEPGQPLRLVYSCCWVALSAVRDQLVARAQMSRFFSHALIHRSRRGGVAVSSLPRVSHCLSRNSLKDQGGRTFKAFYQLRVSRSTPSHISNSTFHQVSAAGGVTGTARDSRDPTSPALALMSSPGSRTASHLTASILESGRLPPRAERGSCLSSSSLSYLVFLKLLFNSEKPMTQNDCRTI